MGVGRRKRQWQVADGLIYGQVKKGYQRRRLARIIPVMRCGTQADLGSGLKRIGLSGCLNTAFIERVNLTIRQSVAALARRTWSTAQSAPQLIKEQETVVNHTRMHIMLAVGACVPANPSSHG